MIPTACVAGFRDELEKLAWFGTYYHGTSPQAEANILQHRLLASKGGSGSTAIAARILGSQHPIVQKFRNETSGRVTMSRSKNLAKMYSVFNNLPGPAKDVKAAVPQKAPGVLNRLRYLGSAAKAAARHFVTAQPLEIAGKSLTGLRRDPSHLLLGVQKAGDIPANLIRKARPSAIGRLALRIL